MLSFEITTLEEWSSVISQIVPHIKHNILLLKGNLGAGKTTFTQYLLQHLGSSDDVSSPTYSIVNEYETPKGKVFHFDLYRMNDITEVYDIGIEEYLDTAYLSIIEWAEIYEDNLPDESFHRLSIDHANGVRTIRFV